MAPRRRCGVAMTAKKERAAQRPPFPDEDLRIDV
jgi:hypothetical protein